MAGTRNDTKDIPPHTEMMWPVLQALKDLGDSGANQEIEDRAIEMLALSDVQVAMLHGDGPQTEVRYRMAWARTYLKKGGALENSVKGVWSLTDYGQTMSKEEVKGVPAKVRLMTGRRHTFLTTASTPVAIAAGVSGDVGTTITSTGDDDWRESLLRVLQELPPSNFEKLCQRILRESGFIQVEVTGRSGDGGIDGIGVLRIALLSFQVLFQCKRYKGSVGASAVRDFRGAMVGRTDKGLLITTGSFTAEAKREATRDGAPVLDLIDGEQICTLLKELKLGVRTQQVEQVVIDVTWLNAL